MDSRQSLSWDLTSVAKRSASEDPIVSVDKALHLKPKGNIGKTSVPEKPAVIAERNGDVQFRVVFNDGGKESMEILHNLRSIYRYQYPEASNDYLDLVNDPKYRSIAIVRMPQQIIGGITFRQLGTWNVAEVALCAVISEEQVEGYGATLIDRLKDYIKATSSHITHILTYADNYYIGFCVKQGFTRASLDKSVWKECRKGLSPAGLSIISDLEWPTTVGNDFKALTLNETVNRARCRVDFIKDTQSPELWHIGYRLSNPAEKMI
ncbi:acyl n-acyltransferase [Fusarium subglutinans]|uniref:Acyl n-acyltransferase n=1 Tax=Gibberella subglutinans TaxID=42677 RepID=A0A8H5P3G4_GIBSU|nr:acyl n-acyltransferase [Fusarium subglutinans]KAF5588339.1 acyl n-acyltransferase [Fusarium subglutinans]